MSKTWTLKGQITVAASLQARNAFERVLGRLKDLRRIVAGYEKTAINFLTAVHLASLVWSWF